jgi:peptide/nickel transport system substrate-binding protein
VTPSSIKGNASSVNPYPYSPSNASTLLANHGWEKVSGVLECKKPGAGSTDCGAGITLNQPLKLSFLYDSGAPITQLEVETQVSEWKTLGINVSTSSATFSSVITTCAANSGKWSICWWGAGWIYSPAIYPTGEILYTPKASFNIGDFNSPIVNAETQATDFGTANLGRFSNSIAKLLPDLWEPNDTNNYVSGGIGEMSKSLKSDIGFSPSPLGDLMPEYYHY